MTDPTRDDLPPAASALNTPVNTTTPCAEHATEGAALPRRDFLRVAGLGAGALLAHAVPNAAFAAPSAFRAPPRRPGASHIVVIGAGIWGASTALELCKRGERVTLVDAYGPGNSRATSGDETRGIRSSYGDRTTSGDLWTAWARRAITHWREFDAEHAKDFGTRFFMTTGDVIMRTRDEPFLTKTREFWTQQKVQFEQFNGDEVRKRWPVINADDITIALYEPDAGVARARHATQATAAIAARLGATLVTSRVRPGATVGGKMQYVILEDGSQLQADAFVFACGPWLGKVFPELLGNKIRVPIGTACYYGTPVNDARFSFPNLPSWNFPGVTGWVALPVDNRGFRVRGGIAPPPPPPNAIKEKLPAPPPRPPADPTQSDPDLSVRWASADRLEGSRRLLERRFPLLANAPLLETRSCHYESSINRNFVIDLVPNTTNAWVAGLGQAEGFKFAPIAAQYVTQRVLGDKTDPDLAKAFAMPTESYDQPTGTPGDFEDE